MEITLKAKKKIFIITAVVNVLLIVALVVVLSVYSSNQYSRDTEAAETKLVVANSNVAALLQSYFSGQSMGLLDKKQYIQSSNFDLTTAIQFLRDSSSEPASWYQLVDPVLVGDNYIGRSAHFDGTTRTEEEVTYKASSYDHISEAAQKVIAGTIDDSIINASAAFQTVWLKGDPAVAIYTAVNIDVAGTAKPYLLMSISKLKDIFTHAPTILYDKVASAIIDENGNYIFKSNNLKNEVFYDYLYIYNNKDWAFVTPLKQAINGNLSKTGNGGSFYAKNHLGNDIICVYDNVEGVAGWSYLSLIPKTSLEVKTIDFAFIAILLSFILFLVILDGGLSFWLSRKLKASLVEAESANSAKSSFLSRMSHEIRTPLNGVIGYTSMAQKSFGDPLKVEDCVNKTEVAARHLLTILNDILDVSAIESGKFRLEIRDFDFSSTIRTLEIMFGAFANDKGIDFSIVYENDVDRILKGDSVRINQILINLLNNAIKFTMSGGKVMLKLAQLPAENGKISLIATVSDSGLGMSEAFLTRIWLPFEQGDSSISRKFGGTGLGLAITKSLIDLMNGTIEVVSHEGEGSTFTVTLPLDKADQNAVPIDKTEQLSDSSANGHLDGMRILLAEDNEMNMEIATELLVSAGASVDGAANGRFAVDMLLAAPPGTYDAVLMDVHMPVLDGYSATREIRASSHPDAATLPIFAMTANAFAEDERRSIESGMNGHLSKPIDERKMFELLQTLKSAHS